VARVLVIQDLSITIKKHIRNECFKSFSWKNRSSKLNAQILVNCLRLFPMVLRIFCKLFMTPG